MEFQIKSGNPEKQRTACVVVGVFEPRRLTGPAEDLDKAADGYLSTLIRRGDLEGKPGQWLLLHNVPNTLADRVLLVGCGRERELADEQYRRILAQTARTLNETGSMEAVSYLAELNVKGRDIHWKVRQALETTQDALYRFDQLKSKKDLTRRKAMPDEAIIQIATLQDSSSDTLKKILSVSRLLDTDELNSLAEAVKNGLNTPEDEWPSVERQRPSPEEKALLNRCLNLLRDKSEKLGIAQGILCSRKDVEKIMAGDRNVQVLKGWRMDCIGRELLDQMPA